MTRQITISLDGQQLMLDLEFEQRNDSIVYHVIPNKHFSDLIPTGFELTQPENGDKPTYSEQGLNAKGKQIADAISNQINLLPPQFKGGKVSA